MLPNCTPQTTIHTALFGVSRWRQFPVRTGLPQHNAPITIPPYTCRKLVLGPFLHKRVPRVKTPRPDVPRGKSSKRFSAVQGHDAQVGAPTCGRERYTRGLPPTSQTAIISVLIYFWIGFVSLFRISLSPPLFDPPPQLLPYHSYFTHFTVNRTRSSSIIKQTIWLILKQMALL